MYSYDELKNIMINICTDKTAAKRKEVKELPQILREQEELKDAVTGFFNGSTCLLVATDQRVLLIDKSIIYGLKVHEIGYDKLSSIEYKTGLLLGELTFTTSGSKLVTKSINNCYITPIYNNIHDAWETFKQKQSVPHTVKGFSSAPTNSDPNALIEQIERLAKLKNANMLTDEEFQAAKAKLLQ